MTWLAVQLVGSALMVGGGLLAFRRSKNLATVVVGVSAGLILAKIGVAMIPAGEARLISWDGYAFIEHWWVIYPSMLALSIALATFWKSAWKRDGLLVVAGYLPLHFGVVAILMARPHDGLTGRPNERGICHQTSGYSCSAASAVMLLHQAGIPSTEKEMAELCVTRAGNSSVAGTSDVGAMRGLRIKMAGRGRPVISTPSYGQLRAPAMVAIRIHDRLSHSVVVMKVEPDQVKVIDPLFGRGTIVRAQFERDWLKSAIHVEVHR